MKIFVGVPREDPNLASILKNECQPKLMFGSTIFQLGDIGWSSEKYSFKIPEVLLNEPELKPFVMCSDGEEKEYCWFYFGINGERLYPFHFSKKKKIFTYIVPDGVNSFIFYYDESFSLFQFAVRRKRDVLFLQRKTKWFGFVGETIPDTLWRLEPMINLAFKIYHTKNLSPPDEVFTLIPFDYDEDSDDGQKIT
ncbi:hypothetical protein M0R01_01005 [bacterium]|nr:hypothetical protein [bacterium]